MAHRRFFQWRQQLQKLKTPYSQQTYFDFVYPHVYALFMVMYVTVVASIISRCIWLATRPAASRIERKMCFKALAFYVIGSAMWVFENTVCGVHGEGGGGAPMQWLHLHAFWHMVGLRNRLL